MFQPRVIIHSFSITEDVEPIIPKAWANVAYVNSSEIDFGRNPFIRERNKQRDVLMSSLSICICIVKLIVMIIIEMKGGCNEKIFFCRRNHVFSYFFPSSLLCQFIILLRLVTKLLLKLLNRVNL